MDAEVDVVVVGAGVVGLAAAAALARCGREVVVIERHGRIAQETSSHNSQVIHAGLYYPAGSLKAEFCVEGRERLVARCRKEGIPHRICGKLVVATRSEEIGRLEALRRTGAANGASGLALVDAAAAREREPHVHAVAALWSPGTGVVDAHGLCVSFAAEAEVHGARLALRTRVVAVERSGDAYRVVGEGPGGERSAVRAAALVNAAGLKADALAACVGLDVDALGYRIHPCKGDYFSLAPGAPVRLNGLVYPLHDQAGLGVHATVDLDGRVRFGPDATYVDRVSYQVDPRKAESFADAVRRYLPSLRSEWLEPESAGVRPKLAAPGQAFRDFVVCEESERGLPGWVNLIGIDSPGLTAAPAIGERVARLLAPL